MNCGQCKYWGSFNEEEPEYRTCTRIVHDATKLTSNLVHEHFDGNESVVVDLPTETIKFREQNPAVTVGLLAALKSKSDFGCVLFKDKNND